MSWEPAFLQGLQELFASPLGRMLSVFCARYAVFLFFPGIVWIWLVSGSLREKQLMKEVLWGALIALTVALLAAHAFGRVRPYNAAPQIVELRIPAPTTANAFPSAHTSTAFALATGIAFAMPEYGIAAYLLAALVGFGRMAAGVHYPTDVLGGIVLGTASFWVVRWLHSIRSRRA